MKKRLKLKSYVLPTLYVTLFIATFYITLMVSNSLAKSFDANGISEEVINENISGDEPVINEKELTEENNTTPVKPYTDERVTIGKYFYDYKADSKKQENSITYHDNTYMQNSGIDYILEEAFDVVSILDGTVTSVKTDDLLGKTVEIKHDNGYVSVYQSLGTVNVKKGDTVTRGQVIGKSGSNELDKDMGNHLHFELYVNGGVVDPSLYIEKNTTNNEKSNETNETNENNTAN